MDENIDNPREKRDDAKSDEEKTEKKFPSLFKWLIVIASLALMLMGAFLFTKCIVLPKYKTVKMKKKMVKKEEKVKKPGMGQIYIIDDIAVNTYGVGGRRFVAVKLAIETSDSKVIDELRLRDPQLKDLLINYFRQQTSTRILELSFHDESRDDLMKMINDRLNNGDIDSLYYMSLILQ